jgi:hypothetical protein
MMLKLKSTEMVKEMNIRYCFVIVKSDKTSSHNRLGNLPIALKIIIQRKRRHFSLKEMDYYSTPLIENMLLFKSSLK